MKTDSCEDCGGEARETNPAVLGDARDPDRLRFNKDAPGSSSAEAKDDVETFEYGGGTGEAASDGLLEGECALLGDSSRLDVMPCMSSLVEPKGCSCCRLESKLDRKTFDDPDADILSRTSISSCDMDETDCEASEGAMTELGPGSNEFTTPAISDADEGRPSDGDGSKLGKDTPISSDFGTNVPTPSPVSISE